MNKLLILIGPPASGKSTFAADYVAKSTNTVIIGRDKLRELLFGYTEQTVIQHYQSDLYQERESIVTVMQRALIDSAIRYGFSVIIDDTNCNYERVVLLSEIYKPDCPVELHFFDTSLENCLIRNQQRARVVPEEAIRRMYENYLATKSRFAQELTYRPFYYQ